MPSIDLRLFGGFQARPAAGPLLALPVKAQALLAYLALRPAQAHPRDKLATLLWGDTGEAHARDSLRHTIAALRKALGPAADRALIAEGHAFALNPESVQVDVLAFEKLLAAETPQALDEAAALYRGDLLEGLGVSEERFEEWLTTERERLRELAVEALAKLVAHQVKTGMTEQAVHTAGRLLAFDPLREDAHRTLMRLYAAGGRRGSALKQYEVCLAVLQRELGVEPEAETKQLYQDLLRRERPPAAVPGGGPKGREAGVVPAAPREPETPSPAPALIGRASEAALLRGLLEDCSRGSGRVALIVGDAGIGKSAIVMNLLAEAQQRGGRVLFGRCHESEQILPFGPWAEALRTGRMAGDEETLERLDPACRGELGRLLPELAAPGEKPTTVDPLRLFESVARMIVALADARLTVVVLDDAHWSDEMTLRLFGFLARRLAAAHVLLAVTAREEEIRGGRFVGHLIDELSGEAHATLLRLAPLDRNDTLALVQSLARPGGDETTVARLAEQVWTLSEGNPFVVVETMRVVAQGMAPDDSGSVPLPQRVREVIASRLDRLGDASRRVLAVAAVAGRECEFGILQRVAGLGEEDTAGAVEELVRRRVLCGNGEFFDFVHDRIREVARGRVLAPSLKAMHSRVAEAIEALHAQNLGEVCDRLAYHYAEAGNAGKAVEFLARVAERATQAYAHEEAVSVLRRAVGHAADLPAEERDRRLPALAIRIAHSLYFLCRYREARDLLLAEQERIDRLADPALGGPYHFALGRFYSLLGDRQLAATHAWRAVEDATRSGDRATLGRAHFVLSNESFWGGRFREGADHGREAVRLLEQSGERWWAGIASWMVGMNWALMGRFEEALAAQTETDAIGRRIGDDHLVNCAAWSSAWSLASRGDCDAALESCRRALEGARDQFNTSRGLLVLGLAHVEKGEPQQAIPILERGLELMERAAVPHIRGWFMAWLAEAYRLSGDLARARHSALQGLEMTTAAEFPFGIATARRALGRLDRLAGDAATAERELTAALDVFASIDAAFEAGRTRLDLAELARDGGNTRSALAHLCEARRSFEALELPAFAQRADRLAAAVSA